MNTLVDTVSVGLEQIQRAAFMQLFAKLNACLGTVQAAWETSDERFAQVTGREYVPTLLESVEPENFHDGSRPSLIGAPIEKYPNVSVMCYRGTPAPGTDQWDHQDIYRTNLVIETMVKAGPEEGEEVCNRRAHRMVEAAHFALVSDKTLGGVISGFDGTPTTSVSELFTRKERSHVGPHWFWQGGRLEFAVRKEAVSVSNHGLPIRADYDQAP